MSAPMNLTEYCKPGPYPVYYTLWIFFAALVMMLNIFVLIAMATSKKILKHNVVYKYVASCLVSAILFCALTIYQILFNSINFTAHHSRYVLDNSSDFSAVMSFYSFSKSLLPGFFLVVQFNIASLIFGVSDNAVFVGRYFNPKGSNSNADVTAVAQQLKIHALNRKNTKTNIVILISWIVPIVFVLPTAFGWSCVSYCLCLPAFRSYSTCINEKNRNLCSTLFLPLSSSFVITLACLWFVAPFIILFTLRQTVMKFHRNNHISEPPKLSNNDDSPVKINVDVNAKTKSFESVENHSTLNNGPMVSKALQDREIQINVDGDSALKPENTHKFFPLKNPVVKLTVILSLSSVLCFFPTVLSMLLGVTISYPIDHLAFVIPVSLTYVYVSSLPFITMAYLPGLRNAIKSNLLKCPCLRTTTVVTSGRRKECTLAQPQNQSDRRQDNAVDEE